MTEMSASDSAPGFIIADDHPLFRGALRGAVTRNWPKALIREAGSQEELCVLLNAVDEVDLVMVDLKMPGTNGLSGLAYLRAEYPSVPLVVVSAYEDPTIIRRAIDIGASGFIPKSLSSDAIGAAIETVMDGKLWVPEGTALHADNESEQAELARRLSTLTPQQVRVLTMLGDGLLNKQIAYELAISEATVKAHVSAILQKLGVESRTQAVIAIGKIDVEPWDSLSS